MLELKELVLQEGDARLRKRVPVASKLPHPILINTIPVVYDNLLLAITPGYPQLTANEGNTVSSEHGGERARLTNYDVGSVVSEYQLLREAIFEVLKQNGAQLSHDETLAINASFDESIRDAVSAFVLATSALRERFAAALTHDLRNPLSAANISAELIRRSSDPAKIREHADRITNHLDRMDSMIQDLLDAMIFQSGERLHLHIEQVDMLEIAKEVCDQFAVEHGPRFHITGNAIEGWWDGEALKRALENLISNALKYGAPDTPIRIDIMPQHGRVLLSVHDEGEPIPPDQLECIFQVFQRATIAKESGKEGWGIGLPYVRSVAESHGGSISVDSTEERGTTFMMDIPQDARPFQDAPILGEGTH